MTEIAAHFDGKVFVPDEPVSLPPGTKVSVLSNGVVPTDPPPHQDNVLLKIAEIARRYPAPDTAPTDLAQRHRDYLYGPDADQP